ncbi:hypothetical protein PFISCL1PPCAC_22669, partial [Pristionchus fissidentatus]
FIQRACRAAGEAELRAERAEAALDSKIGVKENVEKLKVRNEELEKRVTELTNLLDEQRRVSQVHTRAETATGEQAMPAAAPLLALPPDCSGDEREEGEEREKEGEEDNGNEEMGDEGKEVEEVESSADLNTVCVDPLDILRPCNEEAGPTMATVTSVGQPGRPGFICEYWKLNVNTRHLFTDEQAVLCAICDKMCISGASIVNHVSGQHHNWMMDMTKCAVRAEAVDYWNARIQETTSRMRSKRKMSKFRNTAYAHYNLDLHLLSCLDPSHHPVAEDVQRLQLWFDAAAAAVERAE